MVGDPADIRIERLVWPAESLAHIERHGVSATEVEEVFANVPRFFEDLPGRSGTHVMLGPDFSGSFFYVVLAPGSLEGEWLVVTAYRYNRRRAIRHYREAP